MALNVTSERPQKDLMFTQIEDKKFNTESIIVRFITPLDEVKTQQYTEVVALLAESCRRYPDNAELVKKLISLYGASMNVFSYRTGNYSISGISVSSIGDPFTINGEKITADCAQLLLDCIFDPDIKDGRFNETYFEQKRHKLIDKINSSYNNRHSYAISQARDIAFKGEPSAISALGTVENAEKLTSEILADSYKRMLDEAFISITFCGGGTNTQAQELIKNRFSEHVGSRKTGADGIDNLNAFSPLKESPERVGEEIEQAQSKLVMFFKTDGGSSYANKLACCLFGGTPFSKLFMNVREKLSLCYYCQSAMVECKNAMIVDSGVDAGNEQKASDEILKQMEALRDGDFTDEELENTKKYLCGNLRGYYDSADDMNMWYFYEFARGTNDSPVEAAEKIMAVTREEVIAAANGFKLDTVYALKPSGGETDE